MLSNTLLACALIAGVAGEKLNLKVFYETNCPFCQQTIIDEFDATRSSPDCLQEHVKFDWIPYGNANSAGGATICQHGTDECMGNKIHICAKEYFGDDDIGMNNFVVCHEKNIKGDAFAHIAPMPAQDQGSFAPCQMPAGKAPGDLLTCANDPSIFPKLEKMGVTTASFPKAHVPWMVFAQGEENLQGKLVEGVCARLLAEGRGQPACCAQTGRRLLV